MSRYLRFVLLGVTLTTALLATTFFGRVFPTSPTGSAVYQFLLSNSLTGSGLYAPNTLAGYSGAYANLVIYSENFVNGGTDWSASGGTVVTRVSSTDPFGGATSNRAQIAAAASLLIENYAFASQAYDFSIYLKSNTGGNQTVDYGFYDGHSSHLTQATVTTSWQRFTMTATAVAGSGYVGLRSHSDNTAADILADGAMLNTGATAGTYESTPYSALYLSLAGAISDGTQVNFASGYALSPPVSSATLTGDWTAIVSGRFTGALNSPWSFSEPASPSHYFAVFNPSTTLSAWILERYDGSTADSATTLYVPARSVNTLAITKSGSTITLKCMDTGKSVTVTQGSPDTSILPKFALATRSSGSAGTYAVDSMGSVFASFYGRALSGSELTTAWQSAQQYGLGFAPNASSPIILFDGDSLTSGQHVTPASSRWTYGTATNYSNVDYYDFGISGGDSAQRITNIANVIAGIGASRPHNISVLWIGTNDIVEGVTQATWQANITSYISQVKAAGVDKVIFLTILPRDSFGAVNPAFETARQTWNTWVRANAVSTGIDAIADVGADATIGQAGQEDNLTYYVDGTHTTAAGDAIVQGLVIAAINSVVTLK